MKIRYFYHKKNGFVPCCPFCLLSHVWRHGTYERKGFHSRHGSEQIISVVQRYRCVNPDCPHCTFSVLPDGVIPYCRFFWSDLLRIHETSRERASSYKIARQWFGISVSAVWHVRKLLGRLSDWAQQQYRELMNGKTVSDLQQCVEGLVQKHGGTVLRYQWFRTNYKILSCQQ